MRILLPLAVAFLGGVEASPHDDAPPLERPFDFIDLEYDRPRRIEAVARLLEARAGRGTSVDDAFRQDVMDWNDVDAILPRVGDAADMVAREKSFAFGRGKDTKI